MKTRAKNLRRPHGVWLLIVAAALTGHAQNPTNGPGPGRATNRFSRGMMRLPKAGVCPLPILAALPRYTDTNFYARKDLPHGKVEQATYTNSSGEPKRLHIYLPPGYEQSDAHYPVLYLNHGGGDDDAKWTSPDRRDGGNAQFILDNLIAAGQARPMIVVMPNIRRIATAKPPVPGQDDPCTEEYLKSILPYIESHYRAKPGRENRALAGLSMGGFVVLNTGLSHLETFSEFYVYSSGYLSDEDRKAFEANFAVLLKDPKTNDRFRVPFYFAAGETDLALRNSQKTLAIFNQYGLRNFWVLSDGGHEWANWRRYFWQTAQIMFPDCPAAETTPGFPAAPVGFDRRRENIARGVVETVEYDSKTVGGKRKAVIYTPPGYGPDTKHPVLYLLHGIGDDEGHWTRNGSAAVILDNLYADQKLVPMIVVMPNGRAATNVTARTPWNEQGPAFAAFEKDLMNDLLPFVEARYAVKADRESRALAGLSMGGGQSLNFGLKHLETFAWVGGFSSAPNTQPAEELILDPAAAAKQLKLLWLSCGDEDFLLNVSQRFHSTLLEMKVPHIWHLDSGEHTWEVWKNDLYLLTQRLFR